MENTTKPLTTGEIAQYCHVTHRAVLKWVASGKLAAYRTPGMHSRVKVEDFVTFLIKYNMPVPEELKPASTKFRILIVDDDRGMVHSLQRTLMLDNKFEIDVAFDGFEAGKKFSSFRPELIILDLRMPGIDGYQVCSIIRNDPQNKNIKILAISGTSEPQEIQKIKELGANDFLQKPFTNKVLKEKLEEMMR
jgi:two-component system response regulator VicR